MHASQDVIGQFRRKRLLIAGVVAALVLILTLTYRFFEEKNRIEEQLHGFARNAIQRFDRMFSPLDVAADEALGILGTDCEKVRFNLIERLSRLQTVRSILLINHDRIYCSSIYGASDIAFSDNYPRLAIDKQRMELAVDEHLLKGSPILLLWTSRMSDTLSGVLQIVNIELMTSYLLEPTLPWVERAVLNVDGESLEYGNPLIEPVQPAADQISIVESSLRYPFSITLLGPSPAHLALITLPSQLPLGVMLSLLMGYLVWLITASRMSFSWQISNGMNAREFLVYCQPLINSRTGECDGIEMLLRWHNPRQGWIPPDVFIPLAERQDLIAPLTRFVISETARYLPALPMRKSFHIAINVAASHFHDQEILNDLHQLWWPANPKPQLIVELTERDSLPVVDQSIVSHLHEQGIQLAIDDFGTGHSSLSYLKTLNPDILKIDKVFTAAIGTDAINATVIDMVISLAQRLDISLVAEGVETSEQAKYLSDRGVNSLQGYYYARPMPLDDFPAWLTKHQSGSSH